MKNPTYLDSAHRAPLVFPGYGGVRITLSDSYFYPSMNVSVIQILPYAPAEEFVPPPISASQVLRSRSEISYHALNTCKPQIYRMLTCHSVQSWSSRLSIAPLLMPLTATNDIGNASCRKASSQSVRGLGSGLTGGLGSLQRRKSLPDGLRRVQPRIM